MNTKYVLDETVSANSVSVFILPHFFGLWLTSGKDGGKKGKVTRMAIGYEEREAA